jgi:hypothetical protein
MTNGSEIVHTCFASRIQTGIVNWRPAAVQGVQHGRHDAIGVQLQPEGSSTIIMTVEQALDLARQLTEMAAILTRRNVQ